MAVEKSAVREGTRWSFDGDVVFIQEVTPKSVVYSVDADFRLGLVAIEDFLLRADDPATARHAELVKSVNRCIRDNLPRQDIGLEVLAYLLERIGSPIPAAAAKPDVCGCGPCTVEAPHASDCAVHNEPAYPAGPCDCDVIVAEAEPVEDYCAVALPADEPLYDKPRSMKRKGSW